MRAANLTCSTLLLLVMSVPATIATAQTGNAASPPLGKLIDVGGYRVHLYCAGNGGPPVIIAGGGYSFDWGLIQPEVAKFTEVCAYDHSGIGWSDSGPADSCGLRVDEIHTALRNAGFKGPYVLIGYSLGALVVRLYAAQYPNEVAGVVFVDHAVLVRLPPRHPLAVPTTAALRRMKIYGKPSARDGLSRDGRSPVRLSVAEFKAVNFVPDSTLTSF